VDPALPTRIVAQMIFSLLRDYEYEELIDRGECTPEEVAETIISVLFTGTRGDAAGRERQ
jgi:hypothetical protein